MPNNFEVPHVELRQADLQAGWRGRIAIWHKQVSWPTAVCLACILSLVYLEFFAYVVDWAALRAVGGLAPVLKYVFAQSAESSRGSAKVVAFVVGSGLTLGFLASIRIILPTRPKAVAAALICVVPTTALSILPSAIRGDISNWNVALWSFALQPAVGLLLFVVLVSKPAWNSRARLTGGVTSSATSRATET